MKRTRTTESLKSVKRDKSVKSVKSVKRGKRAKRTQRVIKDAVMTLLLLTLSISTAFLIYLHFFASGEEELSGEWTANLDMTKQAAVTAFSWLQDIEGVSVSLEDMESCMQGLTVQVDLIFEQTGRSKGTFQCTVVPESYDACKRDAYETLAATFQEFLAERLHMAGYAGSMDEDALEELVTETFGMSTESYLMSYGPDLLPSLEDLQARYEGSGTYEAAENIMTRQFETEEGVTTRVEYYLRKDITLVLSEAAGSDPSDSLSDDYPVVYTLKTALEQPAD